MFRSRSIAITTMLSSLSLSACADEETVTLRTGLILRAEIVGDYVATTFTVTMDEVTEDLLVGGGELQMSLGSDAQSLGRLFVPGGGADGGDLDESMEGAWSFNPIGQTVVFVQGAETFVRDATFRAGRVDGGVELRTEHTVGDVVYDVVLVHQ